MGRPAATTPHKPVLRPSLTLGGAMALLSLSGAPSGKSLARLIGAGVPADVSAILLHSAPVLVTAGAVAGGMLLSRSRPPAVRSSILGLSGGVVGFFMALCIDPFVRALPLIERVTGPLETATKLDVATWCLAVISLLYGVMTFVLARFGTPAMKAINFENLDPECLEVRPRDRGAFAHASVGLVGQGVFLAALAVAHQLGPDASGALRGGTVVVLTLGALAFAWSSWVLWKSMDELLRRTVVEAYAWSGLLATIGCLVWAVLEAMKIAPPLSAYAMIVTLILVQTVTTILITVGFGSPAQKEAR